jgi:hypothetical protein
LRTRREEMCSGLLPVTGAARLDWLSKLHCISCNTYMSCLLACLCPCWMYPTSSADESDAVPCLDNHRILCLDNHRILCPRSYF